MKINVKVKLSGVDLTKVKPWTGDDSRAVGTSEARRIVARVDSGLSATGKRYIRNPGDRPLRLTGLMLDSFVVRAADEAGVVVDSAAPYATEVQKREGWSGITAADFAALDTEVGEHITRNVNRATGPAF